MLGVSGRVWTEVVGLVGTTVWRGYFSNFAGFVREAEIFWGLVGKGWLGMLQQEHAQGVITLGALGTMPESVVADFVESLG